MYFIPYLFNHVHILIGCIDFSSWLGLACIVLFLIFTGHSYVAPALDKLKNKCVVYFAYDCTGSGYMTFSNFFVAFFKKCPTSSNSSKKSVETLNIGALQRAINIGAV